MILPEQEAALRAIGAGLAALSVAFAGYMVAYGGGRIRVNGVEHLAIFAQPRGAPGATAKAPLPPSLADAKRTPDMTTTGSVDPNEPLFASPRPVEIVAARADRIWVRIDGVIRAAVPGDDVPEIGHIAAIVPRGDSWAVVGAKGETLLTVPNRANGVALFERDRIFK
ncbi:MAG: hypothetical protein JO288_19020 [Hyphomicrobiales bacterium]|nr:hypothetical protein [Hyphomicrobiales bacterium]